MAVYLHKCFLMVLFLGLPSGLIVRIQLLAEGSHLVETVPLSPQTHLPNGQTPLPIPTPQSFTYNVLSCDINSTGLLLESECIHKIDFLEEEASRSEIVRQGVAALKCLEHHANMHLNVKMCTHAHTHTHTHTHIYTQSLCIHACKL